MMIEKLCAYISNEQWNEAGDCLIKCIEEEGINEQLAILGATICEHFGDYPNMFSYIKLGLAQNQSNYELYLLLGNYYSTQNLEKTCICYEHALSLCTQEEDAACITDMITNLRKEHSLEIHPCQVISLDDELMQDITKINSLIASKAAGHDVLLAQPGVSVDANLIYTLRMALYEDATIGIASAMSNSVSEDSLDAVYLEHLLDAKTDLELLAKEQCYHPTALEYKPLLAGFAVAIKCSAFPEGIRFDEQYNHYSSALKDLCMQNLHLKHKNVLNHHSVARRCAANKLAAPNDKLKLKEKWKMDVTYYGDVRYALIDFMSNPSTEPINVLEVGCGLGSTLGKIQYLYPNSHVHGIEIVEAVAALGSSLYDITCGDIERMASDLEFEENHFDYIIFGDVLEHLVYPEEILTKLKKYLKKEGAILASIPNLMTAHVIYQLLHGDFPYESAGIRDRTHLRFFTYNEIIRMFARCGYTIPSINATTVSQGTTRDFDTFFDQLLAIPGVAERKFFDAYQYLFIARKKD